MKFDIKYDKCILMTKRNVEFNTFINVDKEKKVLRPLYYSSSSYDYNINFKIYFQLNYVHFIIYDVLTVNFLKRIC